MKKGIDCFVLYVGEDATLVTLRQLREEPLVNKIYVLMSGEEACPFMGCEVLRIDNFFSSSTISKIIKVLDSPFALVCHSLGAVTFGYQAFERMYSVAESIGCAVLYGDHNEVENGKTVFHPTMDFYYGSVRDDFDFGTVCLFAASTLRAYLKTFPKVDYKYSGWYDVQLFFLRRKRMAALFHLREMLYTVDTIDLRASGERQFDYLNPRNREVQKEREEVCTHHLKLIGAYIDSDSIVEVMVDRYDFELEASVIIPVRNRVKTIADAISSALSQNTSFEFNVIVVDNLSTDGTSEIVEEIARTDSRVVHIVPERNDLGIGGCWSLAFNDSRCGRFAVQLDSDDLYSGPDSLQRIVDKFHEDHCGMVIGSYRMCNFQLETLPPGIIDHREWTPENGHNNALRVNGLGAPRAFFTPLLRKIGMPNSSYGEDYAVGLAFSRKYKIGRIYDELYLCRRWEGNSDSALTPEQVNRNNIYKDSLRTIEILNRRRLNEYWQSAMTNASVEDFFAKQLKHWDLANDRYGKLDDVVTHSFTVDSCRLSAQFNPSRIVSTGAKVDEDSIRRRPCFLCDVNRPEEQLSVPMLKKYHFLLNPNPILPRHFTIPLRHHCPQQITDYYEDMMEMTQILKDSILFYNGPLCGASAPDHLHFQAASRGMVPLERDWMELYYPNRSRLWPICEEEYIEAMELEEIADNMGVFSLRGYVCPGFIIVTRTPHANKVLFDKIYASMPVAEGQTEPMMNVLAWTQFSSIDGSQRVVSVVIPRAKHRPDCYFRKGEEQVMVSPGALDMGGLLVTPREEDFNRMSGELARDIIQECGITRDAELEIVMNFKGGGISMNQYGARAQY